MIINKPKEGNKFTQNYNIAKFIFSGTPPEGQLNPYPPPANLNKVLAEKPQAKDLNTEEVVANIVTTIYP